MGIIIWVIQSTEICTSLKDNLKSVFSINQYDIVNGKLFSRAFLRLAG
jgi:hypothetical protein